MPLLSHPLPQALRGGSGFMVACTLGQAVTGCVSLSGFLRIALR